MDPTVHKINEETVDDQNYTPNGSDRNMQKLSPTACECTQFAIAHEALLRVYQMTGHKRSLEEIE